MHFVRGPRVRQRPVRRLVRHLPLGLQLQLVRILRGLQLARILPQPLRTRQGGRHGTIWSVIVCHRLLRVEC